jgi:hypothetical protein
MTKGSGSSGCRCERRTTRSLINSDHYRMVDNGYCPSRRAARHITKMFCTAGHLRQRSAPGGGVSLPAGFFAHYCQPTSHYDLPTCRRPHAALCLPGFDHIVTSTAAGIVTPGGTTFTEAGLSPAGTTSLLTAYQGRHSMTRWEEIV